MNRSETQAAGNPASPAVPLDLNKLVDHYVQLRDRKRELEKLHKEQLKPFTKLMDEIGNKLLAYMQQSGLDATPTPSGTAYQITKQSATIRDGATFRAFVIEGDHFDLVDWRANAAAVFDFIAENDGQLPPGVNASTFTSVGVRRPNEKE